MKKPTQGFREIGSHSLGMFGGWILIATAMKLGFGISASCCFFSLLDPEATHEEVVAAAKLANMDYIFSGERPKQ